MNILFVESINKIFSFDTCLATDSAQSGRFYSRVIGDSHRRNSSIRVFSLERYMVSWPDNFEAKAFEGMKDFFFLCINREFGQDIATSVSAINASFGKPNFLITLGPKVSMWNLMADLVSERASSYVSPSPTTTPSNPRGYPTYPSSSLEITILNFLNRCMALPPVKII